DDSSLTSMVNQFEEDAKLASSIIAALQEFIDAAIKQSDFAAAKALSKIKNDLYLSSIPISQILKKLGRDPEIPIPAFNESRPVPKKEESAAGPKRQNTIAQTPTHLPDLLLSRPFRQN
ncbi:hypothetical protein ACFLU6_15790, partial [Acidobacteriota bacterium]